MILKASSHQKEKLKRVLVVRLDRLGDVVLSTPVFEVIKKKYPNSHLSVLVQQRVAPLLKDHPFIDEVLDFSSRSFWEWIHFLRNRFEAVLVLQTQFKISLALFLAQIPWRGGPYSKWYSYLFFHHGLRQRRSLVHKHEAEYNLDLLKLLDPEITIPKEISTTLQNPQDRAPLHLRDWIVQYKKQYVLVHPGMGGSALNWPIAHYQGLVHELCQKNIPILLTGSQQEKDLLDDLIAPLGGVSSRVQVFLGNFSEESVQDFSWLLSHARVVVAPSTGPLHIAVAHHTPTVSLFSPIKVQSSKRWGPWPSQPHHQVLTPNVDCPETFHCAGKACPFYFCLEKIDVKMVLNAVLEKMHLRLGELGENEL